MKNFIKRAIGYLCVISILAGSIAPALATQAIALGENNGKIIEKSDIPLRLWYDEEAPITSTEHSDRATEYSGSDIGWEQYSLPIGNGYLGVNVFGRTETERIQLTDKTLSNRAGAYGSDSSHGGLNNFSETYIDFGHASSDVSDYVRYLDLDTAISGVSYTWGGVNYTREYFASYPDKALVIRLDADTEGKLDFTLRPTVPYKQSYMATVGDRGGKTGTVTSSVRDGVGSIELSGKLEFWDVDFLGLYKVYTNGGTVTASTAEETYTDTDGTVRTDVNGTIRVEGATSAYIVVTTGTDYELSSEIFTTGDTQKPTFNTTLEDTRAKVEGDMSAIDARISGLPFEDAYATLKNTHVADYDALFGRVSLEINPDEAETDIPTDELLEQYAAGNHSYYLETLMFQYGRYLLIASSREGTLPANLQGTWNTYETPAWRSGYWHNINVQMNYWPAFSTNLSELFGAYVDFNQAYMEKAEANATSVINTYNASMAGKDGGNGWCIGTNGDAYTISSDRSAGNLGFTTQLYWDYYSFTKDEDVLKLVFDVLVSAARFITKCVELDDEGHYLVSYCDSPEMHVNGVWYYTKGTTYAQTFAYLNNYNALSAAKELGIDLTDTDLLSQEEYSVLTTVMEQIDKYDPIHVGLSGQIKEFREEDYYNSLGGDAGHRHISQLVGLYPGNLINGTTPAWLDAANATLAYRNAKGLGAGYGGWVYAHKMAAYARAKDGDSAGDCLSGLIADDACPNLFTLLRNVFQIDANFGATAGVAEMLLQSHAGYIEPLAAIPSDWVNGSYTGLVARGSFEVGAEWKNGVATCFNITSNKGGKASVSYPSITGATVTDADGNKIPYTVDGTDRISFDTEVGETYIISGFKAIEKPNAPAKLNLARVEEFGHFDLSWTPVDGAVGYNVYVAVENAPAYTLVGSTAAGRIRYTPNEGEENARTTFAVTAVSADGIESTRTLCYYNPTDTSAQITDVYGTLTKSGQLQVTVSGNDDCASYRLYEKADGTSEYVQIYESAFPLLYAATYNSTSTYAVSATSHYDGAESELFVITSYNDVVPVYDPNDILLGKEFVQAEGAIYDAYNSRYVYKYLTDGIIDPADQNNGRFSSKQNGSADATIDLGGVYKLYELRFYLFKKITYQMGTNFTVEAYSNGKWVNIIENVSNETLTSDYLVKTGDGNADWILTIDMGGIEASKIRFHSESVSTAVFSTPAITFYECECSGIYLRPERSENVLLGKEFVQAEGASNNAYAAKYGYQCLTDGIIDASNIHNGRFSSKEGGNADATVDLGGVYKLYELRFYVFRKCTEQMGTNFTVQAYSGGRWVNVIENVSNETLVSDYLVKTGDGDADWILTIDMGGIEASRIRFYAESVLEYKEPSVTFYEIECIGSEVTAKYSDNLLLGREVVNEYPAHTDTRYGRIYSYGELTDGVINVSNIHTGRFSSKQNQRAGGTIDLGGNYVLSELRFYVFDRNTQQMGTDFTVEVYSNGEWIPIVQNLSNETLINDYLVDRGTGKADLVLTFPMGNIIGSKIRFDLAPTSLKYISFYECECSGYDLFKRENEDVSANVLYGAEATVSGGTVSASNPVANAIDGKTDTYLEVTGTNEYTINIDFKFTQPLYNLKIYEIIDLTKDRVSYEVSTASDETTVEVYTCGKWMKLVNAKPLTAGGNYTVFNLYGIEASAIRITFKNTRLFDGETEYRTAKISEITCTTGIVSAVDRFTMIEALEKISAAAGDDGFRFLYDENYLRFKDYAADFTADQATVEGYAQEINAYYEELTQNPSYLVNINYVDAEGYKVAPSVFKYFAANENVKMISPAVDGYYTRDVYVEGVADADGKEINVLYKEIPANVDPAKVEEYLSDIVAWGDSITAGSGSNNLTSATQYGIDLEALGSTASGANYVTVLKNLIQSRIYSGMAVDGCGIGGEATSSIAARADTETYYLYFDGAVTIGTDAVTVPLTHYASGGRVGILRQGGGTHVNAVTVKGFDADGNEISVIGNLSVALSDDAPSGSDIRLCDAKYLKYTFTRTDGGTDALSFVSGARVITKSSYIYDGRTCIIFMGENGGYSDLDELIKQQEEILAACGNPEFFLIVSSTSGSNESRKEIREALSERWGANYINMGDELNSSRASYELAGFSKEVIDSVEANIDAGTVTQLLLADGCHPNAVGYAVVGNVMFERLYDLGAFDAVLDYYDRLNESEEKLKLVGAYLNIANDINVTYAANVPECYENPYMVFEFCSKTYTVTKYTENADGALEFTFTGIVPQLVGENIKATLIATKDGAEERVEKAEYSVLTYCKNMLNKSDDECLKTLLSDLLVYAAASQTYVGYKADTLVTEGLSLTPSTFAPLTTTDKALLGESDARVSWKGVALRYENAMAMKLGFVADETLTLRVTVNGRVTEYTSSAWATDENGNAVVYFRGILATEYGDVVTAAFYDGETQVGQSVTYSVNSYVYSMQNTSNESLATLVQATYNYGASAEIYANK